MASEEKKGEKKFLNERGLARLVCLVSAQVNCFESPSVRASLVLLINLFLPPSVLVLTLRLSPFRDYQSKRESGVVGGVKE